MFSVIVADNPWRFQDKLTMSAVKRGADSQYSAGTMSTDELVTLFHGREKLIADDANLTLWCPGSLLEDGLRVLKAWGFTLAGVLPWVKTAAFKAPANAPGEVPLAFGMGHTWRHCSEVALDGRRGRIVGQCWNKSQRGAWLAPNLKHSAKPEQPQDSLELMFPASVGHRHLELFARRTRPGWVCLGNEIDGLDIRVALDQLL